MVEILRGLKLLSVGEWPVITGIMVRLGVCVCVCVSVCVCMLKGGVGKREKYLLRTCDKSALSSQLYGMPVSFSIVVF